MGLYKESLYTCKKTSTINLHPNPNIYENQNQPNIDTSRIALLVTVLGLLGVQVNPELLSEQLHTIVEGAIAVFGALTGLWAIFKDDEEEE